MSDDKKPSLDLLGVQPLADAVKSAMEGVGTFLSKICMPAAEELGLMLRDRVSIWRARNIAEVIQKADAIAEASGGIQNKHAHPRLVKSVVESGSWSDVSEIQEMWAGLLVSSCTQDGRDESNLMFARLMSALTGSEAVLLNYACLKCKKRLSSNGLLIPDGNLRVGPDVLRNVMNTDDIHRIDRELDHLRSLSLISGGIKIPLYDNTEHREFMESLGREVEDDRGEIVADITPTPLALQMYARTQGSRLPPDQFFGLTV